MLKLTRRAALLGAGAWLGAWATRRWADKLPNMEGTASLAPKRGERTLNDASRLAETPIFRHVTLRDDPTEALHAALRREITEARAEGRPVNVGAARHSMGGQAIPREGHAITYDNGWIEPDTGAGVMQVHAGARWRQVIAALDPLGYGPKVMQSNSDFGVAASFSVNAHGWPVRMGPMGATVRAFDMILPSGDLVTCSRAHNVDLFGMTIGGYGLTGAITRLEVEIAPNQRLKPAYQEMPAAAFGPRFLQAIADDGVSMAYGRLNVDRAAFFDHALMVTYRPSGDQDDLPAIRAPGLEARLARRVYRAQLGNERAKRFRWWTETGLAPALGAGRVTRNSLLDTPVAARPGDHPMRTDIRHEYFVPPDRLADFLAACREVIPASYQSCLDATLRYVGRDSDSWLTYAPEPRIALALSFSQEMTRRAEADMARLTRELIYRVMEMSGAYYLPYRPHASLGQFSDAYPRARPFAAAKRDLDPDLVFRNALWDGYLDPL
ncbi:FAD-binding oxidoreductase [Roseovarius spongiae]|uniref:FAD-binding oxidoreductase n=1 Tax=Roseovarius spongiae TaxID=2320272 RepID=A0A3A8ATZ7_9RHOB|nr:FAD-binding oxidoreductase [Roseovarius spongiae]RKF13094.1 FAD-binding oxidoreductase [Roseovarius spongiae]